MRLERARCAGWAEEIVNDLRPRGSAQPLGCNLIL